MSPSYNSAARSLRATSYKAFPAIKGSPISCVQEMGGSSTRERGKIIVFTHRRRWRFAVTLVRNETQQHSAALKNAGQNPISLLPLGKRKVLHFYDSTLNLFVITSRWQAYLFCLPKPKLISSSVVSCIIIERVFDLSFNGKRIRRATCQGSPFLTRQRSLSERNFFRKMRPRRRPACRRRPSRRHSSRNSKGTLPLAESYFHCSRINSQRLWRVLPST